MLKEPFGKPSQEQPETNEKEPGKFLDFFELSAEQTQELKNKIKEHNGLVRIFVHPEYLLYAGGEEHSKNEEMVKKLKQMNEAMKRVLASKDKKTPPIIILESQLGFSNKLKNSIVLGKRKNPYYVDEVKIWNELRAKGEENHSEELQQQQLANDAYIVPTDFADPLPLINNTETENDAWKKLNDQLLGLGVKKILIAGNELHLTELENDFDLWGCLSATIKKLKDNFEIELSTLTYPAGRRELREKNIKIEKS